MGVLDVRSRDSSVLPAPMVDIARRNLEPMRDRLSLVDDGAEVVPGIRVIAAAGHTPGHVALSITSDGEQLLHISDVVLYPLHLEHPEWVPVFDILPEEAAASKQSNFRPRRGAAGAGVRPPFPAFPQPGARPQAGGRLGMATDPAGALASPRWLK